MDDDDRKLKVPRSRIPKVFMICPRCDGATKTVFGTPNADGYYRRHVCRNVACGHGFYSLAAYGTDRIKISPLPFKDRPLTHWEERERIQWWQQELDDTVTLPGNSNDQFMQRLAEALAKEEGERTPQDTFMVELLATMRKEVEKMDEERRAAGLL